MIYLLISFILTITYSELLVINNQFDKLTTTFTINDHNSQLYYFIKIFEHQDRQEVLSDSIDFINYYNSNINTFNFIKAEFYEKIERLKHIKSIDTQSEILDIKIIKRNKMNYGITKGSDFTTHFNRIKSCIIFLIENLNNNIIIKEQIDILFEIFNDLKVCNFIDKKIEKIRNFISDDFIDKLKLKNILICTVAFFNEVLLCAYDKIELYDKMTISEIILERIDLIKKKFTFAANKKIYILNYH